MPNPQDIFQLAQQTATQVTASPENWRRFLYTAAHNYHTTYLNQLLIHAQRPDATACATMKYWNEQAHRKVMYGSKSIIILQRHHGVPTAKRVFSMTDTVLTGDKAAAPWEVTDAIRPLLMQVNSVGSLMDRATEQVVSLSDRANRVLATSIEDSALNWSHPEDQRFILQEVAAQSTLYMICIRLGIPVREEDFPAFQNVTQFDTSRISLCLGGYVQAAAEPLLDELGHEVMQLARDSVAIQAEPVHNTDTQSPTQTTSREEAVTDDVHERNRIPDSEPELAESQEKQPEPIRQDAAGLLGTERAEPVRPDDAGGNAAAELPQDGAGRTADGGQDAARPDAESADARPQDKPAGLGADVQQPEAAGGGNDPSDAVRSITEEPAAAESEPSPSAFSLPEFPAELLPSLLKADTTSRASNADILSFFSKTPLLIDRLRYIRESYKVVFTELLLEDDTRVGFYKESNGLLVWQGSYLTRSAESHLSWHSVTAAISALVDNHELIGAIDPKKAVSQDEQLSFDLPENASRGDEVGALEVDDIYSEEEQDEKIKAALPTYHYKEPQPDDGSHITEDDVNVIITRGSVFEGGKYRIYNHFQQKKTEKETVAFLKKEYGIGGFSWTFIDGGSGFVNFDGKGFSILYDFKDDLRYEKKLKWKEVGKRLEYLVRMDRYLTDAEREKMPAWINRQTESKPLPPPIPDQKLVCEVGSTVYLENDQRFTVESIGQFDVHLRNEDFPLVGRAVSREQFQQLLDANPRNGSMVLSEQQRESLVQEQREQALSYIEDYLKDEFEITEPDFSNLTQIGLGYTTTEDEQHTIQVNADLEHCTISKFVDDAKMGPNKDKSSRLDLEPDALSDTGMSDDVGAGDTSGILHDSAGGNKNTITGTNTPRSSRASAYYDLLRSQHKNGHYKAPAYRVVDAIESPLQAGAGALNYHDDFDTDTVQNAGLHMAVAQTVVEGNIMAAAADSAFVIGKQTGNILKELKDETINAKDALKAGGKVLRLQGGKSVVKIGGATLRSTEQYLSSFQVSTDDFTGSVPGKVKEAATNTGNILKKITNVVLHPLRNLIAMGKVILMGAVILLFLIIVSLLGQMSGTTSTSVFGANRIEDIQTLVQKINDYRNAAVTEGIYQAFQNDVDPNGNPYGYDSLTGQRSNNLQHGVTWNYANGIYNDTAEIISLAAVYYQQDWPRSELLSAFSDNVPFTKFCRALAAYGLDVTARESAPYSCMSYGGCVNGYRSEGEMVSIKDYRLETHTCSEGDDACGQYDAAAEWHWNEGHAENRSYSIWKEDGTHDVTVFFPIIFPDGATGSALSDLPEEYNAVADGKIKAADCTGNIVLDESANLYKGELNDWFYTPDELTVTFTVVTGEGDDAVSDDYEVAFTNATAIPWCPGELNDGQYGHYDLSCTIYLTGYDRYTDPETQAPNGADGGTGNLEALAESCDAGTLTRTIIKQDQYGNEYAGNAVSARYTKTITLPNGASGFQGWYKDGEDTYGNVEWASLLYRMDWEELYGIVDGIKCRATGSGMTEEELRQLFASLNIDATTARGQVVAFALSCQGKFVYAQPSSLRGGPGSPSVGINLDCSSFVQYCYWAQNLPFSAGSTAAYRNAADLVSISTSEVQPGDLRVVYASGGEQGHVQMALGGDAWIECCYGYGVAVNMSNAWMESRPCYYFRYAGF